MTLVLYNDSKLERIHNVTRININYTHNVIKAKKGQVSELTLDNNTKVYISTNRIRRIYDETKISKTRKTQITNIINTII